MSEEKSDTIKEIEEYVHKLSYLLLNNPEVNVYRDRLKPSFERIGFIPQEKVGKIVSGERKKVKEKYRKGVCGEENKEKKEDLYDFMLMIRRYSYNNREILPVEIWERLYSLAEGFWAEGPSKISDIDFDALMLCKDGLEKDICALRYIQHIISCLTSINVIFDRISDLPFSDEPYWRKIIPVGVNSSNVDNMVPKAWVSEKRNKGLPTAETYLVNVINDIVSDDIEGIKIAAKKMILENIEQTIEDMEEIRKRQKRGLGTTLRLEMRE